MSSLVKGNTHPLSDSLKPLLHRGALALEGQRSNEDLRVKKECLKKFSRFFLEEPCELNLIFKKEYKFLENVVFTGINNIFYLTS